MKFYLSTNYLWKKNAHINTGRMLLFFQKDHLVLGL